jgi:hypothetical protein
MRTSKDEIQLDCLDELQAAKWFLLREKSRHFEDIVQIDKDLYKLRDIELPIKLLSLLGTHFNIPSKKAQTLFEKHKPITKSEVEQFTVLQQLENIVEGKENTPA